VIVVYSSKREGVDSYPLTSIPNLQGKVNFNRTRLAKTQLWIQCMDYSQYFWKGIEKCYTQSLFYECGLLLIRQMSKCFRVLNHDSASKIGFMVLVTGRRLIASIQALIVHRYVRKIPILTPWWYTDPPTFITITFLFCKFIIKDCCVFFSWDLSGTTKFFKSSLDASKAMTVAKPFPSWQFYQHCICNNTVKASSHFEYCLMDCPCSSTKLSHSQLML